MYSEQSVLYDVGDLLDIYRTSFQGEREAPGAMSPGSRGSFLLHKSYEQSNSSGDASATPIRGGDHAGQIVHIIRRL